MSLVPVTALLTVIGSIALFMFGFDQLSTTLRRQFGTGFRETVSDPGSGRPRRFAAGCRMAVLGGSDASGTAALVTIADGKGDEVEHATWILLGINLGGTIVCWILALPGFWIPLTPLALSALVATLPFRTSTTTKHQALTDSLVGSAILMLGMDLTTGLLPILPEQTAIPVLASSAFSGGAAPFFAVTVGLLVSLGFRSTVVTVFLAMALVFRGWIPFNAAAAIVIVANIGPALITWREVRGFGTSARRTAFNGLVTAALAVVAGAVFFVPLTRAAFLIVSETGPAQGAHGEVLRLAMFHTLIHVLNIPLTVILQRLHRYLVVRFVPDDSEDGGGHDAEDPSLRIPGVTPFPAGFPDSLDANLELTQSALAGMADRAYEMLMIVINVSQVEDGITDATERMIALRGSIKDLEEQIATPLTRSVQLPCTRLQAERIQQQQRISQELSLIADDCYKALRLLERSYRKNYRFHRESSDELFDFTSRILDFLRYNSDYLEGKITQPDWDVAEHMEETIDKVRDKLKKRSRRVLERSDDADIRGELAFIDIISYLEHVGDRCLSIAETVHKISR